MIIYSKVQFKSEVGFRPFYPGLSTTLYQQKKSSNEETFFVDIKYFCWYSQTKHLFTACAFVMFSLIYVEKCLFNNKTNNNNKVSHIS